MAHRSLSLSLWSVMSFKGQGVGLKQLSPMSKLTGGSVNIKTVSLSIYLSRYLPPSRCLYLFIWLTDWLTDTLTDWYTDWLTDTLTDTLTDWLTDTLTECLCDRPLTSLLCLCLLKLLDSPFSSSIISSIVLLPFFPYFLLAFSVLSSLVLSSSRSVILYSYLLRSSPLLSSLLCFSLLFSAFLFSSLLISSLSDPPIRPRFIS